MRYLIAYDICCPKRLNRVAKRILQVAPRVQKSVYSAPLTPRQLDDLFHDIEALIDLDQDIVQAWQKAAHETPRGRALGPVPTVTPASVVYGGSSEPYYVTEV